MVHVPGDDDAESSWGVGESDTRARKAAGAARDPRALEVAVPIGTDTHARDRTNRSARQTDFTSRN